MEFSYEHNGEVYRIEIVKKHEEYHVKIGDQTYSLLEVQERSEGLYKFQLNRRPFKCRVATSGELRHVFIHGNVFQLKKMSAAGKAGRTGKGKICSDDSADSGQIQSPINGKIIRVWIEENSAVKAQQDLLIIEAMKMEHRIKSPFEGSVKKVHITEGAQVELGTLLVELDKCEVKTSPEDE